MTEVEKYQWRKRYLNNEITRAEYYQAFLKYGWYPKFGGFTFEAVSERIRAGDFYLNSITLNLWDQRALGYKTAVAAANRALNGVSVWSICEGVCVLKEKARQDAFKVMRENGEVVTLPPELRA